MNDSGTTVPCVCCWMRSSPIAAAAARPSSTSPCSSSWRARSAWCAHTPAKQSAWSSSRTESALRLGLGQALLRLVHLLRDAEQRLHVMADLVGDHVGLREVAGRAEAIAQVAVEVEIDVDLLVGRAVERTHRRLRRAAGRAHHAARTARASARRSRAPASRNSCVQVSSVSASTTDTKAAPSSVASPAPTGAVLSSAPGSGTSRVAPPPRQQRQDLERVDAEQPGPEHQQQDAAAAEPEAAAPEPDPRTAPVLDVAAATAFSPAHGVLRARPRIFAHSGRTRPSERRCRWSLPSAFFGSSATRCRRRGCL